MLTYGNAGALWLAGIAKTALAGCKMRLFKDGEGVVIGPTQTIAELEAAECDFDGYAEKTIAAMIGPVLDPAGGAALSTGEQLFLLATPFTGAVVGGGWIESATGDLVAAWSYEPGRAIAGAGDGIDATLRLLFG